MEPQVANPSFKRVIGRKTRSKGLNTIQLVLNIRQSLIDLINILHLGQTVIKLPRWECLEKKITNSHHILAS